MVSAFFSQIAGFFYARVHFKIKDMGSRPRSARLRERFQRLPLEHRELCQTCTIPLESLAHYPLRGRLNARPRGEKIGDPYASKSSGDEGDVAMNGLRLVELLFYYLTLVTRSQEAKNKG